MYIYITNITTTPKIVNNKLAKLNMHAVYVFSYSTTSNNIFSNFAFHDRVKNFSIELDNKLKKANQK